MAQLPTLKVAQGNYEPLPTDVYSATLTSLEVVSNPYEDGGQQLQWTFTVHGGQYDGRTLRCYTSLSTSPKSKLVGYATVLLGKALQPNDELNLADLIGKPCRLVVKQEPKRDGSGHYNRIESLLPPQATPTQPTAGDPFAQ